MVLPLGGAVKVLPGWWQNQVKRCKAIAPFLTGGHRGIAGGAMERWSDRAMWWHGGGMEGVTWYRCCHQGIAKQDGGGLAAATGKAWAKAECQSTRRLPRDPWEEMHGRGAGWDSGKVRVVKQHMIVLALSDRRQSGTGCSEDSEATSNEQREDWQMDSHSGRGQMVLGKVQQ
jgi:hypothetical protein